MLRLEEISAPSPGADEICSAIEARILDGRLRAQDKLPTVRALAEVLGVSSSTVSSAYQQLRRRGFAVGDGRRGTAVTPTPLSGAPLLPPVPAGARNLSDSNPDPDLLPDLTGALATVQASRRLYGDEGDDQALLDFARSWLASDGIEGTELTLVNGGMDGIERALRAGLRVGDSVAIEDPGYAILRDMLGSLGLRAIGVRVDDEGMQPEPLNRALRAGVKAVVSTPRAQNPFGCHMTPRRAAELRAVLGGYTPVLVLEDDHAPGLDSQPISSLSIGYGGPWALVRSPAKLVGPDLRVALMTGDSATVAKVRSSFLLGPGWVSTMLQRITLSVLVDARDRGLEQRVAATYAERQSRVLEPLRSSGFEVHGSSGFNVWLGVPDEATVVQALLTRGWAVAGGQRFRMSAPPSVRITTSQLNPADASRLVRDIVAALTGHTSSRHS